MTIIYGSQVRHISTYGYDGQPVLLAEKTLRNMAARSGAGSSPGGS